MNTERKRRETFEVEPNIGMHYLRNRRLVTWLYPLQRNDGYEFAAGATFEVLRQDGNKVNLCEVDVTHPFRIGATIVQVEQGGALSAGAG